MLKRRKRVTATSPKYGDVVTQTITVKIIQPCDTLPTLVSPAGFQRLKGKQRFRRGTPK